MFSPSINSNNLAAESSIPTTDTLQGSNTEKAVKAVVEFTGTNKCNESNNTIFEKLTRPFIFLLNAIYKPIKKLASYIYNNRNNMLWRSNQFARIILCFTNTAAYFFTAAGREPPAFTDRTQSSMKGIQCMAMGMHQVQEFGEDIAVEYHRYQEKEQTKRQTKRDVQEGLKMINERKTRNAQCESDAKNNNNVK